jgi:hypothetical protein
MDAERFDHLTRRLGSGKTRRQALAALGAVTALWMQRGRAAQLGPPPCGTVGKPCTMLAGCCAGLTCVTSAINTNYGVCMSGGNGGTVHSGTSLVSPFSDSAQSTGTVDAPSSTTAPTTTGTTTSTTDPKAERLAKRQERKNRRSARRSKVKSRRATKASARKTRRKEAAEAAILAAGPELEFEYFTKQLLIEGESTKYEELRVTNVSSHPAVLTAVKLNSDLSTGTSLSKSLASGASYGFVSGIVNGDKLESDQFWWLQEPVCTSSDRGWIIKAAFSGDVENRTYTVLCDGTVNGVPLTSDDGTTNKKRKKRKRKQQAARRKNRKKKKKDN